MSITTEIAPTVFLSYAREDLSIAEMLYADLRRAGVTVWMDIYDILPGQRWEDEIQRAMETATHYLLLLSAKSVNKRGFVQREVKKALVFAEEFPDTQICLIPVLLSRCEPSNMGLKKYQWVELFRSYELGLQQILRSLNPAAVSTIEAHAPRANFRLASLATAGWGVIFSENAPTELRDALAPLLDLRRQQATLRRTDLYKEFIGSSGYKKNETAVQFLERVGTDLGFMDITTVPFYLLVVGPPTEIPFRFQFHLATSYAVGRLDFDEIAHYAHYARSVVELETASTPKIRRHITLFSPDHPDDYATRLSNSKFAQPLFQTLQGQIPDWRIELISAEDATKSRLVKLHSQEPPGILCFIGHGLGFSKGDALQVHHQGALLCQDWPGPKAWEQSIPPHFYMSADDLRLDTDLEGFIGFYPSCHSAGTPKSSDFSHRENNRIILTNEPFVSFLAKSLLGRIAKPALAVIGHIERIWAYSIRDRLSRPFEPCALRK